MSEVSTGAGLPSDSFSDWHDIMDPEALTRYRSQVRENNGHDMASINYNSLRRLITLIDRQASAVAAWNRRATTEPAGDLVDRVAKAIQSHTISGPTVQGAFLIWEDGLLIEAHTRRGDAEKAALKLNARAAIAAMPDHAALVGDAERSLQDPDTFLAERNEILRTQLAASQADVARLREALNAMVSRWKSSKQNWTQAACDADRELSVTIQNTVLAALDGFPIEQAIKALGAL